jgi:RNA polymerase sigma factor for flagellar operon FliA
LTSVETEQTLWTQYKEQGDESARDDLLIQYMRVVKYVAGRMAIHVPSNVELDDLIGWGVLGLMDAVEKFDHTQNIKFSTYATIRIRGSIIDQIRTLDWAPRSLRAMARKVGSAREKLRHEKGSEPSYDEIGDEIDASGDQVEDCLSQIQTAQVLSLDDYLPGEDREESRKVDITPDTQSKSPESAMEEQERQAKLVECILNLPEQQQKVLNLYYYEELTLKEIGMVLEVSESRVSQIHSAAIKKLRKAVRSEL